VDETSSLYYGYLCLELHLGSFKSPVIDQFFLSIPAVGLVRTLCGDVYGI